MSFLLALLRLVLLLHNDATGVVDVAGLGALPTLAGGPGLLEDKNGWERAVVGMAVDAPSSPSPVPAPPPPWPSPGAAAVTPPWESPSSDPTAWVRTRTMKGAGRAGLRSVG